MITWTLTEAVVPEGAEPGEKYWEVAGSDEDPHDARYYPTRLTALSFLINLKMKRGDTLHYAGADTGRILRVGYVLIGETIEYDVGTRQLENSAALIEWLDTSLQPGDTVAYLPLD